MSDSSPDVNTVALQPAKYLGRYKLVARLGQGGMGTIHLAVAGGLGEFRKPIVLKELRTELTRDAAFVGMFLSEAKLAAQLSHPNVVQTVEASQDGGRYFLVMEFLDGQPFSEVMRTADYDPRITLGMRLHALCEALSGLHYAHELRDYEGMHLSVVHRDVSPHNLFVTYDGQIKVVDFGIAKVSGLESATVPGVFKGRFAYGAPEQVRGQPVDRQADIFAVGVMLWEAVAMQRFSRGKPTREMITARILGREPRLKDVMPEVDPALAQICDRAMDVEPSRRFASAEAFRRALQQYLVATGQETDAGKVSVAMRVAFATQRDAIHKLIAPHLADNATTNSMVRPLLQLHANEGAQPLPAPHARTSAGFTEPAEEVTAVTDLRDLVEATRSGSELSEGAKRTSRPRTTALALGAAAAALAIGAYFMRGPEAASPDAMKPISDISAATNQPTAATTTAPEQDPKAPVEEAVQVHEPSPASVPEGDLNAPPPDPEDHLNGPSTAPPADRALQPFASRPRQSKRRAPRATPRLATTKRPRREGTSEAPKSDRADRQAVKALAAQPDRPATSASTADNAGGSSPGPLGAGQDLRPLRRSERRALDLEDPFQ